MQFSLENPKQITVARKTIARTAELK